MAKTPKVKRESATKAVTEEAPVAVVKQEEAPQASLLEVIMAKSPKVKQEEAPATVVEEVKQEEAPQASLTRVRNVSRNRLRQFSTGMIIAAGEEKDMIHESWLESQIEAGLLKKV